MVKEILTGAGFVENETFKAIRFLDPPDTTYAIYLDAYERRGSDDLNLIKDHNYTIELYMTRPDPGAEARIEAMLDLLAIPYEKDEAMWLQSEQLYQVVYRFEFLEK